MEIENNQIKWKYIVYETTNTINNKIYIGVHKTINPDVFDGYIGNGIIVTQPYTYKYSKTAFQCAVNKYGPKAFRRKTLAVFNTEDEAFALEEELVNENFLAREDVYNMILGGRRGLFNTSKIKVYQYDLDGNYVSEYPSFIDAATAMGVDYTAISYAVRKKFKSAGFYWNTDKCDRIDLKLYNKGDNHRIPIYVYSIEGNFLEEFSSTVKALATLKVSSSELKEAYMLGVCLRDKYYVSLVKASTYDKARTEYIKTRSVHKYDSSTGEYIASYATQELAERENINSNISRSIKLKVADENGFFWSVEKTKLYNCPIKKGKRKVGKYDLEGNLVEIYESATEAANKNGTSVWKVLSGTNKTHKKHVYKYLT